MLFRLGNFSNSTLPVKHWTINSTDEDFGDDNIDCPFTLNFVLFGTLNVLSSLPGIFLNSLFIFAVLNDKHLRKILQSIVALSFGDLAIALYILVLGLCQLATGRRVFNLKKYECFYKRPFLPLFILGSQWQSTATFLVAVERMIALVFPYRYYLR